MIDPGNLRVNIAGIYYVEKNAVYAMIDYQIRRGMYLVTGGCGFIGSHIAQRLLEKGHSVRILDNLSAGRLENISGFREDIEFIKADVRDTDSLRSAMLDVRGVFHQAALVSVAKSVDDPALNHSINVDGTFNVLNTASECGVEKVLFASSAAVYGNDPSLPKREDMDVSPDSPYGLSKYMGEIYGDMYSKLAGLKFAALRYFNVYGPRQDPSSPYSGVISLFSKAFNSVRPKLTIYGDGEQTRDFVYVDDVVNANLIMMDDTEDGGCVFNAATGVSVSLNHVIGVLEGISGRSAEIEYKDARTGDIKYSAADISLLRGRGYAPEYGLEKGLASYMSSLEKGES